MIHLLFHRSLRGQWMPVRGSEILNTSLHMEAGHPREILKSPQQQETQQPISLRFKSLPGLLVTISSKQSCYQIKANDKKRTATGRKRHRICILCVVTRTKLPTKTGFVSSGGHKRHPKHQASSTVLFFLVTRRLALGPVACMSTCWSQPYSSNREESNPPEQSVSRSKDTTIPTVPQGRLSFFDRAAFQNSWGCRTISLFFSMLLSL